MNEDSNIDKNEHSPCLDCSDMKEYFPRCEENCGMTRKRRYPL
jgi:hypothetical protein